MFSCRRFRALAFVPLLLTGTSAFAQAPPPTPPPDTSPPPETPEPARRRRRFRIGPEIGVFLPTNSKTKDRFGSSWETFGIGIGSVSVATLKGQTTFDLSIIRNRNRNDNNALIIPVGLSYRRALNDNPSVTPYIGLSANLYAATLRSDQDDVHSGFRGGGGGSAFVGTTFGESGQVEARYHAISKIKGFDLSGLNLSAGYRF